MRQQVSGGLGAMPVVLVPVVGQPPLRLTIKWYFDRLFRNLLHVQCSGGLVGGSPMMFLVHLVADAMGVLEGLLASGAAAAIELAGGIARCVLLLPSTLPQHHLKARLCLPVLSHNQQSDRIWTVCDAPSMYGHGEIELGNLKTQVTCRGARGSVRSDP